MSKSVNLDSDDYNHDYDTCMLTYVHCHKHCCSISVICIIQSGLCFTQPLIVPTLNNDDPKAIILNSSKKNLADDPEFVKKKSRCNH